MCMHIEPEIAQRRWPRFLQARKKRTTSQVEFEDFSYITQPENKAVVHGMVTSFSPIKENSTDMSDEIKRLRLVGYQEDKQEKVAQITNMMANPLSCLIAV